MTLVDIFKTEQDLEGRARSARSRHGHSQGAQGVCTHPNERSLANRDSIKTGTFRPGAMIALYLLCTARRALLK